jgi:glycosyltransferase involved in cell wall biosynthesis
VRLLPSGVDTNLFSPGASRRTNGPTVLFMGTIYRFSGLDRVIRDWKSVLAVFPTATLLIVGAGEDQTRLAALAHEVGVTSNVTFTGMQPYSALPEFIRSSDICINPFELNGITGKILPTKLFQYLACGKPVVATRLPGTVPFLSGEEDGVLYSDTESTVSTLTQLLADPERCAELGTRGILAAQRYDWSEIAKQMAAWLEELTAERHSQ